ncbi:13709_t:CDS:1, partial [Racocetra persica]
GSYRTVDLSIVLEIEKTPAVALLLVIVIKKILVTISVSEIAKLVMI